MFAQLQQLKSPLVTWSGKTRETTDQTQWCQLCIQRRCPYLKAVVYTSLCSWEGGWVGEESSIGIMQVHALIAGQQ